MRDSKYEIIKIILLVIIVVCVGYIAFKPAPNGYEPPTPRPWQKLGVQLSGELRLMDGTIIPPLRDGLSAYQMDTECFRRQNAIKIAEIAAYLDTLVQLRQR